MTTSKISFIALLTALPLLAGAAAPTVKITTPTKSPTTNGVLTAAGTTTGVEPITNYYSFDGGAWTQATGGNTWSVSGLILTAGSNTFSAYAQDATGTASRTNTVAFIYVVNVPVVIETNGEGTVTPIHNGESLEIGKKYTMTAKADKGFAFTNWDVYSGLPVVTSLAASPNRVVSTLLYVTNTARLSFTMASNLTFVANFRDSTRPVCIITYPAAKQSVSNSPITVTGKASDNVGVTTVNYQLNGGGWNPATLTDATDWQTPNLALNVGANVIQAFATDAAGNVSLTNTINFNYVSNGPAAGSGPAPASLANTVAVLNINGGNGPFSFDFGSSTFAQVGSTGEDDSYTGTYSYTLLSSNTAQLDFSAVLPPGTGASDQITITFTNDMDGTFTDTNGNSGTMALSNAPDLALSPSSIITAQWVDVSNNTNSFVLSGGLFTNTVGSTVSFGNYYFTPYSPLDMMLVENYTDANDASNVAYIQLDFSSTTNGQFSYNAFDDNGDFLGSDSGAFTILSTAGQPSGNAPDSAAGLIFTAKPNGNSGNQAQFELCFGTSTFSSTSADSSKDNVGAYSYVKTGPNTAQFTDFETEPLLGGPGGNGGDNSDLIDLTFTSSTKATVTDQGTTVGTITVSPAGNLAPASVAGKTVTAFGGSAAFGQDGTVTITGEGVETYTYAQYSPNCGMVLAINPQDGSYNYLQLVFTTSSGGTVYLSAFSNGQINDFKSGNFTIK